MTIRMVPLSLALLAALAASQPTIAATPATPAKASPTLAAADAAALDAVLKGDWRNAENTARDVYRHPKETLAFFGVKPTQTVVEITPGGGWYAEVLGPYLKKSGHYVAAVVDPASMDAFYNAIAGLRTATPAQQSAQQQALAIASRLVQARALLMVRDVTDQVQWPFLAVLVSWLAMLFLAMGLFVRANSVIHAALVAGSLAVGGAIFLILELEQSRSGLLHISDEPLRFVLQRVGG